MMGRIFAQSSGPGKAHSTTPLKPLELKTVWGTKPFEEYMWRCTDDIDAQNPKAVLEVIAICLKESYV